MSRAPAPFVPHTDHQEIGSAAFPAFARVAERLDAGEEPRHAVDHLSRRENSHLSRLVAGCRPIEPWIRDQADRRTAIEAIREVCR